MGGMKNTNERNEAMKGRAGKGGQVGRNGEWYPGGTFLPSTELPKMAKRATVRGTGRVEVAPYEWAVPADEALRSLWADVSALCEKVREGGRVVALQVMPEPVAYYGRDLSEVERFAAAWTNGARWFNRNTREVVL